MDSLSQIVLGAAVCGAVTRQPLRRALAYGAVLGTLPDLDVLVLGHLDPVEQFVRHRSFSHSLFVLSAAAPLLAWLLRRLDRQLRPIAASRWWLAVWLVLITHPLLDACTVYGTQLWWPLTPPPTSWANVFIIDPLYTLPLLIAVLAVWWRADAVRAAPMLLAALLVSHAYLAWGWLARQHVEREVAAELARRGQQVDALLASPAPFTTLLWRVIVRTPEGHAEAWYSLLRGDPARFELRVIAADAALRTDLPPIPALRTLHWFSHGFLKAEAVDGRLRVADLRMGADPDYFFAFDLARQSGGEWRSIVPQRAAMERPRAQRLQEVWERL
jgi:inner membrane protein